jgi:hypothetical protein
VLAWLFFPFSRSLALFFFGGEQRVGNIRDNICGIVRMG